MKYTKDKETGAEYIKCYSAKVVRTIELRPGLNVDISSMGRVVGVEILYGL